MIRVAIHGYGRIGRNVHRNLINHASIKVVAINARSSSSEMRVHLLKYDSLHGKCEADIKLEGETMIVNGDRISLLKEREIKNLPWQDLKVDIVIDATGVNRTYETASQHLKAGAKKVIVSAPMKDTTPTYVIGVNEDQLTADDDVISNASCTTNCIAPVLMIMDKEFGIENAMISSIHSFTTSQNILDNNGSDFRRCRSAVESVIPTTTGSVKATGLILPNLKGKLDGMAFRVPLATSSCADMTLVLKKETTADEINQKLKIASKEVRLKGILGVCEEPLVSIDFKTDPRSSIIDALSTKVVQGKYVQIIAWYDNEWAYARRLTELVGLVGKYL